MPDPHRAGARGRSEHAGRAGALEEGRAALERQLAETAAALRASEDDHAALRLEAARGRERPARSRSPESAPPLGMPAHGCKRCFNI